ncbi:unnamed protein product [Cuscuta campestris]|uniref:Uncharacterized protein n=1 Tax=Cuscuta campestris TaxID=132261 RepID=A0A484K867_9ASTE|nr:unnamed protein product [Cuscuta campestris]
MELRVRLIQLRVRMMAPSAMALRDMRRLEAMRRQIALVPLRRTEQTATTAVALPTEQTATTAVALPEWRSAQ